MTPSFSEKQHFQIFDSASTELRKGITLIEASAGTGKTYAIAMIALRLVAEYGLKIDELLLVTFTTAATQELADRIRARLDEARYLLRASIGKEGSFVEDNAQADPTLCAFLARLDDHALALQRIEAALLDMDRAPIFTIHSFCNRTLQEQTLQTHQLPGLELVPDISDLQLEIAQDFWRKRIYPLDALLCGVILDRIHSPQDLFASVFPGKDRFSRIEPDALPWADACSQWYDAREDFLVWWRESGEVLLAKFAELLQQGKLKKSFSTDFAPWRQSLCDYCTQISVALPGNLQWLTAAGVASQINGTKVRGDEKKAELLASLPFAEKEGAALQEASATLVFSLRHDFAKAYGKELDRRMIERNLLTYDDLISRLYLAVMESDTRHENALGKQLGRQYRAALIDEFQDTDVMQWQIFSHLFGQGEQFLYLIGDPKQSIYRFRGADISSYFKARESAGFLMTLKRNYRSHPLLVQAVNNLFSSCQNPFLYPDSRLIFFPVEAGKSADDGLLSCDDEDGSGLFLCSLPEALKEKNGQWGTGTAKEAICSAIVEETFSLLAGQLTIQEGNGEEDGGAAVSSRPVKPSDIAILVRTHEQAEAFRMALSQFGIPSVVAGKQSVFQSGEAEDLLLLLHTLLQLTDTGLFKGCLALDWFGMCGDTLYNIFQDQSLFESWQLRFSEYLEMWQRQGCLFMLRTLIEREQVWVHLGSVPQGERRIANIVHLQELLQQVETESMFGPLQLVEWLQNKMKKSGTEEDEWRLEKDEEAVAIVTNHASKGLEYPIVFCPYLWQSRKGNPNEEKPAALFEKGEHILDLGSDKLLARKETNLFEEKAEAMRILYVALTRARLRCYLYWADVKGHGASTESSFESGLGRLLFNCIPCGFTEQQQRLAEIAQRCGGHHVLLIQPSEEKEPTSGVAEKNVADFTVREKKRLHLDTSWQMTSYSALSATSMHEREIDTTLREAAGVECSRNEDKEDVLAYGHLPAGAAFGNVVHELLEVTPFASFMNKDELENRDALLRTCQHYGVDADVELLAQMLRDVVSAAIPLGQKADGSWGGQTFMLSDLQEDNCVKEMNFFFHLREGSTVRINEILHGEKTVLALQEREIAGFLRGFVDLVFQVDGKYYIADYKTNNLGEMAMQYSRERIVAAMASHNYGLQLWIYTLVLHHYLKNVVPGYSYERHFGGVYYFFVRGMGQGAGIYFARPDLMRLGLLAECFGVQ